MDVPREGAAKKRLIRRVIAGVIVLGVAGGITFWLSKLQPAAVSVEFSTVWPDTVKRGPMLRNVRGMGTLVPEEVLFVPAISEAQDYLVFG